MSLTSLYGLAGSDRQTPFPVFKDILNTKVESVGRAEGNIGTETHENRSTVFGQHEWFRRLLLG